MNAVVGMRHREEDTDVPEKLRYGPQGNLPNILSCPFGYSRFPPTTLLGVILQVKYP